MVYVDVSEEFAIKDEVDDEVEAGGGGGASRQAEGDGAAAEFEDNAAFVKWVADDVEPLLRMARMSVLEQRPKNVKRFLASYFNL